jgi:hypothetical protein
MPGFAWCLMSRRLLLIVTAVLLLGLSPAGVAEQAYVESAEKAANALVIAVARHDEAALGRLLGQDYRNLLPLDEIDSADIEQFLEAWAGFHTLLPVDTKTRLLVVGEHGWTLPIPLVREVEGWRFDTVAGLEMMRIRRVGRNELSAMQAILAYHDAQMEYATQDRDGDGVLEYAQQFISSPGKQDGLYWTTVPGEPESPLGPLFAEGTPEGAYYGYYYRILKSQGPHAAAGALSYLVNGNMIAGFALVAWPAEYGTSGVMSFMLSRSGTLYQADLGPEGGTFASAMLGFDPDARWTPVLAGFTDLEFLQ